MLTPSYSLTATERVLPVLAFDFTTALLNPLITVTRSGNTATVTDSSGVIVGINANLPRFDYDPTTLVCRGLLIEDSRTNVLLNSLLDGTSLATQSVTVTAAGRTLSFYGTGQVVLSGAHSATVTGTGAYPARTTLTFTPSAGTLTLTVTGTVQFAQLETGAFATSFIPTAASEVTRNRDEATVSNLSFFNAAQGSIVALGSSVSVAGSPRLVNFSNGTQTDEINVVISSSATLTVREGSANRVIIGGGASLNNTKYQVAIAYSVGAYAASLDGAAPAVSTYAGALPVVNVMTLGARGNFANYLNGALEKVFYYPFRLTNAEIQAFSKQG